jgi:hypothetical protein
MIEGQTSLQMQVEEGEGWDFIAMQLQWWIGMQRCRRQ